MGIAVKIYYITGTSRGLGRAMTVDLLKDRGNRVFGIGRTCTITNARYRHLFLDLIATESVRQFKFQLPRRTESAVLINNAGVVAPAAPVRIFSIAPGVVDTGMQKQIREIPKKNLAGKQRFVRMKAEGMLAPTDEAAKAILRIIAQPQNYSQTCLDVREIRQKIALKH